tara:strand:- start:136 stop:1170 length:1035 start_codon:yes stop_codon:yes gene_type:complete
MFFRDLTIDKVNELNTRFELNLFSDPIYLNIESERLNGSPMYWINSDKNLLIPIIERSINNSKKKLFDLVSPYGYPGILSTDMDNIKFQKYLKEFNEEAWDSDYLSTFIRMNPLSNVPVAGTSKFHKEINHGEIVYLDLSNSYSKLYTNYGTDHKRDISSLNKSGFKVKEAGWNYFEAFKNIYYETMKRHNAADEYYFTSNYMRKLFNSFDLKLLFVEYQNTLIATSIFIFYGNYIYYHLSGTKTEFHSKSPLKLLIDHIIKTNSKSNYFLILGGGLGGVSDKLFTFKQRFSYNTLPFTTIRFIHDLVTYKNHCIKNKFEIKKNKELIGFFPLYRSNKNPYEYS